MSVTGRFPAHAALFLLLALAAAAGCGRAARTPGHSAGWFRDVTRDAGVRFQHRTGQKDAATILETTGAGCAFWDYDEDGHLDIFLVNGLHSPEGGNRLYRNDGQGGFRDVTDAAGVRGRGYGMGCAVGDYDGDGRTDLYVCNFGRNELFRNRGDGTFEEVAARAGVQASGWSTGAAFLDADGDGDLDLYVGRYSRFGAGYRELCGSAGVMGSCSPRTYPSEPDLFYENLGQGRYREASERFGIRDPNGRSQGVLVVDYDRDGRPDIYVPNDTTNNYLFHNRGGRFAEVALPLGVAYGPDGRGEASMGVDAGDYDGDGRWDLLVGNFQGEMDALYRQTPGGFEHEALAAGLGEPTLRRLTFGLGFFDFDNDGALDVAQVNGHVNNLLETVDPDSPFRQPRQLFRNEGGRFTEVTALAGTSFTTPNVGRGMAFGDYDNDGRVDILVSENNGPAALLRNEFPAAGHWLSVRLIGPPANRLAIGARVELRAGGRAQMREVRSAASFISVNDARCHFGLGGAAEAESVVVRWPDGRRSEIRAVAADRVLSIDHAGAR